MQDTIYVNFKRNNFTFIDQHIYNIFINRMMISILNYTIDNYKKSLQYYVPLCFVQKIKKLKLMNFTLTN